MKLKPPKNQIKGTVTGMCRYLGRVKDREDDNLALTIWVWYGNRRGFGAEYFSNICLSQSGVTRKGKFTWGTPVEIWTWQEIVLYRWRTQSAD